MKFVDLFVMAYNVGREHQRMGMSPDEGRQRVRLAFSRFEEVLVPEEDVTMAIVEMGVQEAKPS